MDLSLPDAQGVFTVQALRPLSGPAPIVVLTGRDDEQSARQAMLAGAQDYLCKGEVDSRSLRRAVRYAIERIRAEDRLAHIAHHDQLTQLANRTLLLERLNQAISRGRRAKSPVAVLFLDLDRFKAINDSLGHHVGDRLLTEVARRLAGAVRDADTVARLGGDEFAIVLEELATPDNVTLLAQRLLNSFATPFSLDGIEISTSTSIGIVLHPHNGDDTDQMLKAADSAVYRAKETGRNNYQFFSSELHERAVVRANLEQELERALTDK